MSVISMGTLWKVVMVLLFVVVEFEVEVCGYRSKNWRLGFNATTAKYKPRKPLQIEKEETWIWPMPAKWMKGDTALILDSPLELVLRGTLKESDILEEAFQRYNAHIYVHGTEKDFMRRILKRKSGAPTLKTLVINVLSDNETVPCKGAEADVDLGHTAQTFLDHIAHHAQLCHQEHHKGHLPGPDKPLFALQLGTDESYTLNVPAAGNTSEAYLEDQYHALTPTGKARFGLGDELDSHWIRATNIYGALRGMETFSQLCRFNFEIKSVEIIDTPWIIKDSPRFPFRGLMIDTSRHYLPLETIRKVIDSMTYAKFNVLHWHIVDTQSFPLEIPSYPELWKGAYTKAERYTIEDAENIVEYARRRGINVMPELDTPGHAASWGVGYPKLWPSSDCQQPLDVSSTFTFEVISGILADFRRVFPFKLMHLGGDEVDTTCWSESPHIHNWLTEKNLTAHDAYATFVLEAQRMAINLGWTPVNWEEPFNEFGDLLSTDTVVHEWLSNNLVPKIVEKGLKCIVSNQDVWYLDHLDVEWESFYLNEPLTDLNSREQQRLVIGGEVCMWGETADPGDIEATIWPRAAAAAERLWSPAHLANSVNKAFPRLSRFKCLLHERGIGAAPVRNFYAREGPQEPGSCYDQ